MATRQPAFSGCWRQRTAQALHAAPWPLPNVHLGVSVEDQPRADLRIPALLDTPAAVRFLSCEPLLGPVDLEQSLAGREASRAVADAPLARYWIDWVIVGGESGRNARPMHPDWVRALRDQCQQASVSFFFKQWGEWGAAPSNYGSDVPERARASARLLFSQSGDDGYAQRRLFLAPPEIPGRPAPPSLSELWRAMADAHPDRGGTDEAFIAARARYERAQAATP